MTEGEDRIGKLERIVRPAGGDETQKPLSSSESWDELEFATPAAQKNSNGHNGNGNGKTNAVASRAPSSVRPRGRRGW